MYLYLLSTLFYYILYHALGIHPKTKDYFPNSSSLVTKEYRIVNVVKSSVLGIISPASTYILYQCFTYPYQPSNYFLHVFGATYASLDMSAIIYNPYNHVSTNVHHVLVQMLYGYCYYTNFSMDSLSKPVAVYAIFSAYSYLVNYRLAIRFMNLSYERLVNKLSLYIYTSCCAVNWGLQLYLLALETKDVYIISKLVYLSLLFFIISDDIFLIKFLSKIKPNRVIPQGSEIKKQRSISL